MARRRELSAKKVDALKPAAAGARYEVQDTEVRGLSIRVTDKGTKTFALYTRYPGSLSPSRRSLGEYGELTLAEAREKARQWRVLIKRGVDPRDEEDRQRTAELRKRQVTVAAVFEDFAKDKLSRERSGKAAEKEFRRELLPTLKGRPVAEVTDLDILGIINRKKLDAPVAARNLLALAKRFFAWAIDQRTYGVTANPCAGLRTSKIIGDRESRDRILSDDELFALWRAAGRIPYPHGPAYQLLVLTALRLNEVGEAAWAEVDAPNGEWTIPAERMKARPGKARPHVVPLTADIQPLLKSLPRFKRGHFLFSTNKGESPAWLGDKLKKRLDARMLLTLKALARKRGDDPAGIELERWTNHDIRRTVRSHLSRLKISEEAREALLAHVRPGVKGVYDRHDYFDEKKEALETWAARLRSIVSPPPSNVVSMATVRAS